MATTDNTQQRAEIGEQNDETNLQTMERAEELSTQFEQVKDRTIDGNTILGQLTDIETSASNNSVLVVIDLPGDGEQTERRFDKPRVWDDRYKFVRWVKYYGYDADSFPSMLEDQCKVKVTEDGDNYRVFVPDYEQTFRNRMQSALLRPKSLIRAYVRQDHYIVTTLIATAVLTFYIAVAGGLITLPTDWKGTIALFCISVILAFLVHLIEYEVLNDE